MKKVKHITALIVFLIFPLTFTLSIALQKGYTHWRAQPVSLCTATEYRTLYRKLRGSDTVHVKGFIYGGGVFQLADADVNGCRDSVANIEFPEDDKAFSSEQIQNLLSELRSFRGDGKVARVEVALVGTLTENARDCFSTRYAIQALQIVPMGSLEIVDGPMTHSFDQ